MITSNTGAHAQMSCASYSVLADRSGSGSTDILFGCGSGTLDIYEDCDDGNLKNGDGCSSECQIEFGFECCINGKRILKLSKVHPLSNSLSLEFDKNTFNTTVYFIPVVFMPTISDCSLSHLFDLDVSDGSDSLNSPDVNFTLIEDFLLYLDLYDFVLLNDSLVR